MILRKRVKPKNWYHALMSTGRAMTIWHRPRRDFRAQKVLVAWRRPMCRGPLVEWKRRNWYMPKLIRKFRGKP